MEICYVSYSPKEGTEKRKKRSRDSFDLCLHLLEAVLLQQSKLP